MVLVIQTLSLILRKVNTFESVNISAVCTATLRFKNQQLVFLRQLAEVSSLFLHKDTKQNASAEEKVQKGQSFGLLRDGFLGLI